MVTGDTMAERNKGIIRRYVDEVYTKGNLDVLEELISPHYVNHTEERDIEGIEGLRAFALAMRAALPDMRHTIHVQLTEGDLEAHRWTISGTHQGEWAGIPASGNPVAVKGLSLSRIEDGKVAEEWTFTNSLEMMMQIGALPAEMMPGAR